MASIIVDKEPNPGEDKKQDKDGALVSWVMSRVNRWRQYRDSSFADRWDEYYRLWRGRWHQADKTRRTERSKFISPVLASSMEQTVAEMEEATFGREQWFDVQDDDAENGDALTARDSLLMDFNKAGVPGAIAQSYLNGALYGTMILKLSVLPVRTREIGPDRVPVEREKTVVFADAVPANEFVPDPAGRTIDEMLGCAHEVLKPLSWVQKKQRDGIYSTKARVRSWAQGTHPDGGDTGANRSDLELHLAGEDSVMLTEYHGLVPARMLPTERPADDESARLLDELLDKETVINEDDEEMVEAIVTIANKGTLLRAVRNPFLLQDRAFVAAQFEPVPGRFWGRGVMEKGYNAAKALDTEVRSRHDALALISNPMMGADVTRLPRGFDFRVWPGKVWITNGSPKDVLEPISFPGLQPGNFQDAAEMERMLNVATGQLDMAQMLSTDRPNATTSSIMAGAFIKRSKRAMQNISRNFLEPIVKKSLHRYMQFEPDRYPADYEFRVVATMGIMAREFEQSQLTQLMGQIADEVPAPKLLLLKAIVENSSTTVKKALNEAIDSHIKQVTGPEAQEAQKRAQQLAEQVQQTEIQKAQGEVEKLRAEVQDLQASAQLDIAKAQTEAELKRAEIRLKELNLALEARNIDLLAEQNAIQREKLGVEREKIAAQKQQAKAKPKTR